MKRILSKEDFVRYINKLEEVNNKWSQFYELLNAWPGGEDKLALITEITNLLEFIMEDEYDDYDTWIGWYCWETDFGHDERMNKIWEAKNSKEVERVIDTPEKLYDLLVENIDEREDNN